MAQMRICRVDVQINRDANSGMYYLHIKYENKEELPVSLRNEVEPEMVHDIISDFIKKKRIKCTRSLIKIGISQLINRLCGEMGTEDKKSLDLKLVKWSRTRRR
jgi:hypothetical protein